MGVYVVIRRDRSGKEELRNAKRQTHRDWLAQSGLTVLLAGPLMDPRTSKTIGSLFVLEARVPALVKVWCAEDPYAKAGLFADAEIMAFRPTIGAQGPSSAGAPD